MRISSLMAAATAAALPFLSVAASAGTTTTTERCSHPAAQRALDRLVTAEHLPGAMVRLQDPACGGWVGSSGTADLRSGRPMRPGDRFRIGSTTKTFTATVVLQLVAQGRIGLDAPVARYLPGLIDRNGYDGHTITVRQLLQHTSGLADHTDAPLFDDFRNWRYRRFTPRELVGISLDMPHPKKKWSYSTTNYVIAGMLVHKVTGRSIEHEVTDRIIRPLGLQSTYWPGDSVRIRGPHPRGYQESEDGSLEDVTSMNVSFGGAGGALISSLADLQKFYGALLDGHLLPPAQLRAMRHTVPADPDRVWPGANYGLGVIRTPLSCGGSWTGHAGSVPGFRSVGGVSTTGRRIAIALNEVPPTLAAENAFHKLIDTALCENPKEQ